MEKDKTKNQKWKDRLDWIIKIVLIIIIILLLIHNCQLQKKENHKPTPNGNVDIIEIICSRGACRKTPPVEVTEISFFQESLSIQIGNAITLIPKIYPTSSSATLKLIWKSSDPSIATIDDNGVVKGLREGIVTITVTSSNGLSTSCTIQVVKDKVEVNKITLDSNDVSLYVGDFHQIVAKVEPENATDRELVFESSNPSIATVDNYGIVEALKKGVVTITVKTKDGKVKETCKVTVEEIPLDQQIEVFDQEKDPITWNGSKDLKIFNNSIYSVEGTIAPESENTYQFIVRNNTTYKIKYNIKFIETNDYNINMKYKLKKNEDYIFSNYANADAITVVDYTLDPGENDTYYLDWKWISSNNDTSIGKNPDAKYGLKIEVKAESIND